ncbi:MAG: GNAT family N-acetyltransferase [Lentilitoribacter sp.]
MSNTDKPLTVQTIAQISDVSKSDWDQFIGASKIDSIASQSDSTSSYNPFISHDFLSSLEHSGSVSRETGWMPQHLVLSNTDGDILGALPSYVKSHSQGEYVFDHAWADAWERAGGHYYPKLQCSIPFTPATGPRLLVNQNANITAVRLGLASALCQVTEQLQLSSAHITFMLDAEADLLKKQGFLIRNDQQFHFENDNYQTYADFLDTLASRKRKALKKERRIALENDISIEWLTGEQLTEDIWDQFYQFYIDTGMRKWGRPYLTRSFFSLIGEKMSEDILLIMAKHSGRYIAGAINFIGSDCLYGRHWGCIEDHPYLHFEVCYHQAIDYAIANGLKRVEAGAQGQHKLARGYLPKMTYSAHYIPHEGFRNAISDYLHHERQEVGEILEILETRAPFKAKNS